MRRRATWGALILVALTSGCELLLSTPEIQKAIDDANGEGGAAAGGSASGGVRQLGGDPHPSTGGDEPTCEDDCAGGAGGDDSSGGSSAAGGQGGQLPDGCLRYCDCDADGFFAEGLCGGDDCDDDDDRVRPNQTLYFAFASGNPNVGFDYDCSDTLDRDPAQGATAISCLDLDLLNCANAQGFHGTMPACGVAGNWGTCQGIIALCSAVTLDASAIARCR